MISRIWSLTVKYRGKVIIGIVFFYTYMLLNAILPSLTKNIIDCGLNNLDLERFKTLLIIGAVVVGLLCITSLGANYILIRQYQNIKTDVKCKMYQNILEANYGFLTSQNEGQIVFRILNDTNCIDKLLEIVFMAFPGDIISVTILFLVALTWDIKLSIFMIIVSIIQVGVTKVLKDKTVAIYKSQQVYTQQLSGGLTESIGNITLLKGVNMKSFVVKKIVDMFNQIKEINVKYSYTSVVGYLSTGLINSIWTLIILWYGVILVMKGEITVGSIMGFLMISQTITPKLSSLFNNIINFNALKVSFNRVFEYYDVAPSVKKLDLSGENHIQEGQIEARNIGFAYNQETKIINGLSFIIKPHEITAIVGENGCGKSTLCMILKRFLTLEEGEILVDGVNINEIDIQEFNEKVFYQPQNKFLINTTILENITCGSSEVNKERLEESIKITGVDKIIQKVPQGYNTLVGSGSRMLSGGEMQKIALARLYYMAPKILILDEPTAFIDIGGIDMLKDILGLLAQRSTVIVVTHNKELEAVADKVINL